MKVTTEFRSNSTHFLKRTARRLACELLILAALTALVAFELVTAIPVWLQLIVLSLVAIYIGVGLALYPRARATVDSFSIKLHDQGLTFAHRGGGGELQYSDLTIAAVRKDGDSLTEIVLTARSGQTIKLEGLENMGELYRLLSQRVA